MDQKQMMVKGS